MGEGDPFRVIPDLAVQRLCAIFISYTSRTRRYDLAHLESRTGIYSFHCHTSGMLHWHWCDLYLGARTRYPLRCHIGSGDYSL